MDRVLSQGRMWSQWIAVALIACLAVFVWEALSDEPTPPDQPHRVPVAVIEIARVFKDHRRFNERMAGIKAAIEVFERDVQSRKEEIAAIKIDQAEKAARLEAELTDEIALKRKEFLTQEAHLYFETYTEIEACAAKVCDERDIGLLLRYSGDEINKDDRASVLQGVNRAVVHRRVPDLTSDVLGIANSARKL